MNADASTCGMLVRVTGGMSLDDGALYALDGEAEVCGRSPVRTIGGWRRVDIAIDVNNESERETKASGILNSYHFDRVDSNSPIEERTDQITLLVYRGKMVFETFASYLLHWTSR